MRIRGFEPPRYCYHTDLNRARLPIPPYPHIHFVRCLRLFHYNSFQIKLQGFFQKFIRFRARHKPGSVFDNHLSRPAVTDRFKRPTYRAMTGRHPAEAACPFWSCSEWGLHEKHVTMPPRELLPHDFTLTAKSGGMFLLHFPYSYLRRTLSGIPALWSPDFPHAPRRCTRLSVLPEIIKLIYLCKGIFFFLRGNNLHTVPELLSENSHHRTGKKSFCTEVTGINYGKIL